MEEPGAVRADQLRFLGMVSALEYDRTFFVAPFGEFLQDQFDNVDFPRNAGSRLK